MQFPLRSMRTEVSWRCPKPVKDALVLRPQLQPRLHSKRCNRRRKRLLPIDREGLLEYEYDSRSLKWTNHGLMPWNEGRRKRRRQVKRRAGWTSAADLQSHSVRPKNVLRHNEGNANMRPEPGLCIMHLQCAISAGPALCGESLPAPRRIVCTFEALSKWSRRPGFDLSVLTAPSLPSA